MIQALKSLKRVFGGVYMDDTMIVLFVKVTLIKADSIGGKLTVKMIMESEIY